MQKSDLIFITGHKRCGTTVFRLLMKSHGAYDADEIFSGDLTRKDRFYEYLYERVQQDKRLIFPGYHQAVFDDYIAFLLQLGGGAPIAIDVKYHNYDFLTSPYRLINGGSFIVDYMKSREAPVVHIERKNKLRIYVSELIAIKTGVWGTGNIERIPSGRLGIIVDIQEMKQKLNNMTYTAAMASKKLSQLERVYNIIYEEMFDSEGNFSSCIVQLVKEILGVSLINPKPSHIKINRESLQEIIANYEDVVKALAGTPYEWMTTE